METLNDESKFEEDMMFNKLDKNHSKTINSEIASKYGLTLEQTKILLESHGVKVEMYFASEHNFESFLKCIKNSFSGVESYILVNFKTGDVGYSWDVGHFSPICAYNSKNDSILLLDVWPSEKRWWIPSSNLYESLKAIDFDSKKSRGWLVISRK